MTRYISDDYRDDTELDRREAHADALADLTSDERAEYREDRSRRARARRIASERRAQSRRQWERSSVTPGSDNEW